jgi:hypothetical protein
MDEVPAERRSLAERLLSEAYEFVLSGWCQDADAVDECMRAIEPASAFARRWSAAGALERAWQRSSEPADLAADAHETALLALVAVIRADPAAWNDREGRRQSEVLDALAEALHRLAGAGIVDDLDYVGPRLAGADAVSDAGLRAETPREP